MIQPWITSTEKRPIKVYFVTSLPQRTELHHKKFLASRTLVLRAK